MGEGKPVQIQSPQAAIQKGIGLLTEDRKGKGLFLKWVWDEYQLSDHPQALATWSR